MIQCAIEDCENCVNPSRLCWYHRSLCICREDQDHPDCPVHEYYPGQWAYEAKRHGEYLAAVRQHEEMKMVQPLCICGHEEESHNSDFRGTKVSACVNGCDCEQYQDAQFEREMATLHYDCGPLCDICGDPRDTSLGIER